IGHALLVLPMLEIVDDDAVAVRPPGRIVVEVHYIVSDHVVKSGSGVHRDRLINRNAAARPRRNQGVAIYHVVLDNAVVSVVQLYPACAAVMHDIVYDPRMVSDAAPSRGHAL